MHIKSKTHSSIAMFFLKPYTLSGFEPGSAVSEAAAMSTWPLRQGIPLYSLIDLYNCAVQGAEDGGTLLEFFFRVMQIFFFFEK
jgi:hypothetical protein